MISPWESSRETFSDVLQALTSAAWHKVASIADFVGRETEDEGNLRRLFLLATCSICNNEKFSNHLELLAKQRLSSAVELSIAGAHLSLCSQFLCINQVDSARREALAFAQHVIAAATIIGFSISDSEQEILLERAGFLPDRIESQQSLSLATRLGHLPRRMLFVLGMHRSGTSALAGMLRELGLDLPSDLLPPTTDNPKGYFESTGIVTENDSLLASLGTSWRLEKSLPPGWIDKQAAIEWRQALLRRLHNAFGETIYPVVKDPRFCVLLAGLSCWLQADVIDFRFVLLVRHPLEVVKSLMARPNDPIAKDTSLQLWVESVLAAERNTRGMQRMVVIADDLFEFPARIMFELQRFIQSDTLKSECDRLSTFVDPELRHHRFNNTMLGQPALGMSRCDVLEDLATRIYDEIKSNQENLPEHRLDELHNLWLRLA